ncbi:MULTISPECIES: sugar ABC transporter ATP-binding protein [unclassified Mesorhizobium]|uniref:sugar ABC transporter ATP-binding protein n=1 Tax=unclassified Mesorhizobium TaxID=325217 RepID=UPI00086EF3C9|nr:MULTISPECIES: sugar ABC transporter ATP-binding protein [unclassified Mesorhizobium]MBN9259015.1 sugar ABC transporter ATP-binding protein [Mesorhizobium sp.]MBN9273147.1 sugar ABC transporter ATP-binding protein [Mesorhizobium sp.]ODT18973.1 MAG: ABC transporter ATP-binding protein [Mesorhizobium sp. SCN 65-12]OJX75136.1 MAG: ABC transporter ATP-binding protein [Mesorhizobium sp. 65-26]
MTALLELKSVTKAYRGVPAVSDISVEVHAGEVLAILGENGAGKSTLTKIMAGVVEPTKGEVLLEGKPVRMANPEAALDLGIAMVFQETSLVPSMTVGQNLFLGDEKTFNRLRGVSIASQQFLQSLNFNVDPTALVSTLGVAKKQMVEIARAVRKNVRLIIFDEPTASLTPEEKQHFFALVGRLKARGIAIVFISHALEEALMLADRIMIMRDGLHVVTGPSRDFDRDSIIRSMVGRTMTDTLYGQKAGQRRRGAKILSVENLSLGKIVRNTSFSIYAGQITGMFGLIGSGRTETAKIIAGVLKRNFFHGGTIRLEGRPVRYRVPRPAVNDGIVYVTEDRKVEGFFEQLSITDNLRIGHLASKWSSRLIVKPSEIVPLAEHWRKALQIRAINGDTHVVELSGGNQQKVVIAKSLLQKPKLVIFDEPTRGVDVGAIAEIHALIKQLAEDGLAVIVISSYLPEVLNLSDRILVFRQGRVVEEFSPQGADEETIMYASVH